MLDWQEFVLLTKAPRSTKNTKHVKIDKKKIHKVGTLIKGCKYCKYWKLNALLPLEMSGSHNDPTKSYHIIRTFQE